LLQGPEALGVKGAPLNSVGGIPLTLHPDIIGQRSVIGLSER
jgi:hypothetical protein